MADYNEDDYPEETVRAYDPANDKYFEENPKYQRIRNWFYRIALGVGIIAVGFEWISDDRLNILVTSGAILVPTIGTLIAEIWSRRNKTVILEKK